MKILIVHNSYQQQGGEDIVFEQEKKLLQQQGHAVSVYQRSNLEMTQMTFFEKIKLFFGITWSKKSYNEILDIIDKTRPDLAHIHNTFCLITPAVVHACKSRGLPVVVTLHNYRLLCPRADFYIHNHVCEKCTAKKNWLYYPALLYGCYHNSRFQTLAVAVMLTFHRLIKTWYKHVNVFIALTEFSRQKFIAGGLPSNRIIVKPNFTVRSQIPLLERDPYGIYVGRLSPEKSLLTLMKAMKVNYQFPLKIIGTGKDEFMLKEFSKNENLSHIQFCGHLPKTAVLLLLRKALFLVLPSNWFEGFPLVIVEAFANGVAVITSRIGSMQEIVEDQVTGLHFTPGDAGDLAKKIQWAATHPQEILAMGQRAYQQYLEKYSPEKNYDRLIEIYDLAMQRSPV